MAHQPKGIAKFFIDLADKPDKEREYKQDPRKVLSESDLTADEQELVLTGSLKELRQAVQASAGGPVVCITQVTGP